MAYIGYAYGMHMPHGTHKACICMVCTWCAYGTHILTHGVRMVCMWYAYGMHMGVQANLMPMRSKCIRTYGTAHSRLCPVPSRHLERRARGAIGCRRDGSDGGRDRIRDPHLSHCKYSHSKYSHSGDGSKVRISDLHLLSKYVSD